MGDFERVSTKKFETKMTKYINYIYSRMRKFHYVYRSNRETSQDARVLFMDKELAIDTFVYFTDGQHFTFQEKTRDADWHRKREFTFEYMNNPQTGEPGEFFKLGALRYFYGYANANQIGYAEYWILNVAKLKDCCKNYIGIEKLENKYLHFNRKHGRASFFAIPFWEFEQCEGVIEYHRNIEQCKSINWKNAEYGDYEQPIMQGYHRQGQDQPRAACAY